MTSFRCSGRAYIYSLLIVVARASTVVSSRPIHEDEDEEEDCHDAQRYEDDDLPAAHVGAATSTFKKSRIDLPVWQMITAVPILFK